MASIASLLACAAADITIDQIKGLIHENLPEGLTLEYKVEFSASLVKSVAAMANTYGGLILVGVTDDCQLVGVPAATVDRIVNACHDTLEPPWEPEVVPVPLTDSDLFIAVLRIHPSRAPRSLLLNGAAPIRLQGRNATADWNRLAQLFNESRSRQRRIGRLFHPPEVPRTSDGSPAADFILRSGMLIQVDEATTWRALSERSIEALAYALDKSLIQTPIRPLVPHLRRNWP